MSTLGAVLQGMDRGVMNGLNLYKTVQDEARQKRMEQYQVKRDNRRDMEADRAFDFQQEEFGYRKERDVVGDQQWEDNFKESQRVNDASIEHNKGVLAISRANQNLSERKFNNEVGERERLRQSKNAHDLFTASLYDEQGQYITDNAAYAQRANANPAVLKSLLDVAADRGLIDPKRVAGYTGAQLIATPQGLALRVAGKDATGKPIKEGGGILSQNGTDDPNDPYMLIDVAQLRQLADPKFRDAQRSDALLAKQSADNEAALAQEQGAVLDSLGSAKQAAAEQVEQSQQRIAELEAQAAQLEAQKPTSLGGTIKNKVMSTVRDINPAVATLIDPEGTMGYYGAADADAKRAEAQQQMETERQTLASALQDVDYLQKRTQQVPQVYSAKREQALSGLQDARLKYGEQYAAEMKAQDIATPAKQAAAFKESNTRYDKVVTNVIADNVFKPRKGEPPPKVSAAQFRTMMSNVDPAVAHRVGSNREYEAAVYSVAEHVARSGVTGKLELLLEASAAGADLDAYTQLMGSTQYRDMPADKRHAAALEVAKRKAQNPEKDIATLAGAAYLPK
jgi:hypothetical protein